MKMTINYKGVDLQIDFDYQPFEKAETGPEAQYPGCGEAIEEINEITHKGTCFFEVFENDIEDIKNIILSELHKLTEKY